MIVAGRTAVAAYELAFDVAAASLLFLTAVADSTLVSTVASAAARSNTAAAAEKLVLLVALLAALADKAHQNRPHIVQLVVQSWAHRTVRHTAQAFDCICSRGLYRSDYPCLKLH